MHFRKLSADDGEFGRIADWMASTIMQHKCVRLSEFSIKHMLAIENPVLSARFAKAKQRIEREIGATCEPLELFHGSPFAVEIAVSGFNEQHCKNNNMFGKGVYLTKHASKANQYSWGANTGCPAHEDRNCDVCLRYLLVCSCLLGRQFTATFQPLAAAPPGVDSVVAEPSFVLGLKYAEYVLLSGDQALPKVLVAYHAVRHQEDL